MAKYVFGCSVKSVESIKGGMKFKVVPNAEYSVKRKGENGEQEIFAVVLPDTGSKGGFVVGCVKGLLEIEAVNPLISLPFECLELVIEPKKSGTAAPSLGVLKLSGKEFNLIRLTVK